MTQYAQSEKNTEPKITEIVEEYCEAIHNLNVDEGKPAIAARLAERMGVSPVTVFGTIQRLEKNGFVIVDAKTKEITLTEQGEQLAVSLARRHRLAERLLVDVLGLNWEDSHEEACRLEHAISPKMEQALTKFLNNPATCPHGNPIPGSGYSLPFNILQLDKVEPGAEVIVTRISEEAEHEPGLLHYLQEYNLVPGVALRMKGGSPFNETLTVINSQGKEVTIGIKTANKIGVTPA